MFCANQRCSALFQADGPFTLRLRKFTANPACRAGSTTLSVKGIQYYYSEEVRFCNQSFFKPVQNPVSRAMFFSGKRLKWF
jgi:hypothetical protein